MDVLYYIGNKCIRKHKKANDIEVAILKFCCQKVVKTRKGAGFTRFLSGSNPVTSTKKAPTFVGAFLAKLVLR